MNPFFKSSACLMLVVAPAASTAASLEVTAVNPLPFARSAQTIELSAEQLAPLGVANLNMVHVRDSEGKELVCQAIDLDGDPLRKFDAVLFQADFAANATATFTVVAGAKQVYKKEQFRAFGRFVRERFDDFAWENDLVAHRTYGKALETWEGEPLSSSTIDAWSKRTPRMVINDWYLADDYHVDHGEGADFYSAGLSRGCGGTGLWADGRLWVSRNFVNSTVLANGPIRVLFELEYAPYTVNGVSVTETRRVSLDGGSQFNKMEARYKSFTVPGKEVSLTAATGLKKVADETVASSPAEGWLSKWEKVEKNSGNQGMAIIASPADFVEHTSDSLNQLVLLKPDKDNVATYWFGSAWDKAGRFTDAESWKKHVAEEAKSLVSPVQVSVKSMP